MFGLLDIPKMLGAAVLAALLTWAVVAPTQYLRGRADGKAAIVAEVSKRNHDAGHAATVAKSRIDACDDVGGTWRQETGTCDK